MIPYSLVTGYSTLRGQVEVAALADLRALLAATEDMDPQRRRELLIEAFPEVLDPYAATASAVSATFYEEMRDVLELPGRFDAETLPGEDPNRWRALAGWGARPAVFEQGGNALMYSLLSGGLKWALTEMAADTVIGNAVLDPAPVRYQRVPSPGCCAFCGMLASRSDLYLSEASAGVVVGRGMPLEKTRRADGTRKRGRQAGGIRTRGSRKLGEDFHDHCRCDVVPVTESNGVQMQADAERYFKTYEDARNKVAAEREAEGYKGYGDQSESRRRILAKMREELGVK